MAGSRGTLGSEGGGGCGDLTEHRNMLDISGFLVRCRKLVHLRSAGRVDPADDEVLSSESKGEATRPRLRFQDADMTVKSSQPRDACAHLDIQAWYWTGTGSARMDGGRWTVDVSRVKLAQPQAIIPSRWSNPPRTDGPAWLAYERDMLQRMTAYPGQARPFQHIQVVSRS